jgi:translin
MIAEAQKYPDIYHAGYTQDALKELAEAHITEAVIWNKPIPSPESLQVEHAAYLNGLAEAAGELRRFVLDALRRGEVERAEEILREMDDIYSLLLTIDFPSAITGGLKRSTDMVRGVLERTRGDVTTAVRQEAMKEALRSFEERVGLPQPLPITNDDAFFLNPEDE